MTEKPFEPAEITKDTDEADAKPVEVDETPDVAEDPLEDDAETSPEPVTEGDGT